MINSILLTLILPHQDKSDIAEEIEEMKLLANTIGYNIQDSLKQNRSTIDPATYFGKGKIKSIIDNSNTVLWNGPAGYFENPNFENGTKQILEIISKQSINNNIFSVAGGGETVAAINKFNKLNSFTFISTAGGAFLEYLEGKTLPGIKALNQNV